jgi:serine/threonine protein kinase
MNFTKNNNKQDKNTNANTISVSTIQSRLLNIKKLMDDSNLQITNPLKNIDAVADTECFTGHKNNGDRNDSKSLDTRTVLGKKSLDFYKVINQLDSKLIYIKSGAYGNTFKGIVYDDDDENEIMSFAVKVVAYPKKEGYGSLHNITRPENAEICMLKLLSYFVIKCHTPHVILPISIFDTNIKPFLTLQEDDVIPSDNTKYTEFVKNYKEGLYYERVSVIISEWANRGDLGMFLKKNYKKLQLIHWQCIFFQIISTLAVIQYKYPAFRHNDLKANNILVSKVDSSNKKLFYKVNKKEYILPAIGYSIFLWDFDFACIPGVVENSKVYQEWTNKINITSRANRYYDVHYFFCTLIYKGFLPELMTDSCVPSEVKKFTNYVLPEEYRPGHPGNKVHKRCRLLVDDELYKPVDLLNHDFFKVFQ